MEREFIFTEPRVRTGVARAGTIDYAAELNAEQFAAVMGGDGPRVVLAGAGSGKTRTIVYRVAHLIERGVRPDQILLLTFTNKAASEMMARIAELLAVVSGGAAGLWGGTFHSIANRLLRSSADRLGFTASFTILDEDDGKALLKACLREAGLDAGARRFPSAAVVREVLSYARNSMTTLSSALEKKFPKFAPLIDDFSRVVEIYDRKKRAGNVMDFDDLLVRFHDLLVREQDIRDRLSAQFCHILVDEYQDTNALQAAIIDLLVGAGHNIFAVGDDAQSIYSFRAAEIRNILDFPKRHPGAKIFNLNVNYRSTPEIVELANEVISHNVDQFPKELRSAGRAAAKPVVVPAASAAHEADFIASRIEEMRREGREEAAVLFRATFHSQALEFELMKRGVPYEYRGGMKFFDRAHVKDALAYMRAGANSTDEAAWLRVLSMQRGIGEVSADRLFKAVGSAASDGGTAIEAALGARAAAGWREARRIFESMRGAGHKPTELIRALLASPYGDYLEAEYPNYRERLEDLERLAVFAEAYETVDQFLADITLNDALSGARASEKGAVRRLVLSTIHQAKGLEWDVVFVMHLSNSGFPNRRAALEESGLEEERRLFYVAVTRARRQLYLTYPLTAGRDSFGLEQPSMFLEEVGRSCLDWGAGSDRDGDGESCVEVGDDGELRGIRRRMKQVNDDWRKKSFLRDIK